MSTAAVRDRLREVREEVILDAAYELMAEHGYGDMSMDEVAARTGMSKATIYQFFPSKQELAVGVVVRNMARNMAILDGLDSRMSPIQRMERGLRQCLASKAQFDAGRLGLPQALIREHPRYHKMRGRLFERVTAMLEDAKAAGEVPADITAPMAVALCEGLFHMNSDHLDGNPAERDQLIEGLVTIIFRGLRRAQ
ncbi:MAG: TetR/AcrR family transcriptional regulator [Chloroflexi bacterium]|nr:TetR/AcrR family transcriptional regulator [Chloroflexota bacterium]